MSSSLNDKAIYLLANIAEVNRLLDRVNDIGDSTGFCDELSSIENDAHNLIGALNERASRLKRRYTKHIEESASASRLEKQYSERIGRMAQLCDTVIPWLQGAMSGVNDADIPTEVRDGITEIMDYVDAVRP